MDLVLAIRRVQEHDDRAIVVRLIRLGPPIGVGVADRGAILVAQRGDVAIDQRDVLPVPLDEDGLPAPRLSASSPSAPVPANRSMTTRSTTSVAQDIEQRLAHHVARRPRAVGRPRPVDLVPAALPRDDPHGWDARSDDVPDRLAGLRATCRTAAHLIIVAGIIRLDDSRVHGREGSLCGQMILWTRVSARRSRFLARRSCDTMALSVLQPNQPGRNDSR